MSLFLYAAVLVAAFMAAVTVWLAFEGDEQPLPCAGWWVLPSAVLGILIVLGVVL